jgi:hypothetical protein
MLSIERRDDICLLRDELAAMESRRMILVNELNDLAQKVEYGHDDYDASIHWDRVFSDIAYVAGIGYEGHRPGKLYTFWIPSADNCW